MYAALRQIDGNWRGTDNFFFFLFQIWKVRQGLVSRQREYGTLYILYFVFFSCIVVNDMINGSKRFCVTRRETRNNFCFWRADL